MGTIDAKILVVDDAKFMRRLLRQMLGEGGYRDIEEAADGDEALLRFRERRPDLVLLDITMPGTPGMAVLSQMLAIDPAARVVICSAVGQETVMESARQAGACGFVRKPFSRPELLQAVSAALARGDRRPEAGKTEKGERKL